MSEPNSRTVISEWPEQYVSGSKRTNLIPSEWINDWFVGHGKDESCYLEGSWWDMICLARNILASRNTQLAAPEYYHPEWENDNYTGEEKPYEFCHKKEDKEKSDGD